MAQNLNIIIDTDPGTDDALALGVAAAVFKDNIRAVISSYGNVGGEQTHSNLVNIISLFKIDTNIIKGSQYPLENKSFTPTNYHGENGLCGLVIPVAKMAEYDGDFLQEIYDTIKKYGNIKYIAIGPLTNLALLLERFPDSADYINEAIIMGGGFEVSNMPHDTEFNFSVDPLAVKKVLESSLNKVIAPLDMTHKMAFSLTDIEEITGIKRELLFNNNRADDAFTALAKLLYLNHDTAVQHNEQGAIIHDATTLVYLYDKSDKNDKIKCGVNQYKIISDEYGAVKKHTGVNAIGAFVIDEIDRDFMKSLLKETFCEV